MAQSHSAGLETAWEGAVRSPSVQVQVDWNKDGDFGDAYEDISAYVLNWDINHSLYDPMWGLPFLGRAPKATLRLTLNNEDHRFSSIYSGSPLYSAYTLFRDGMYGLPVQVSAGYSGTRLRQFTGYLEAPSGAQTATANRMNVSGIDRSFELAQNRQSTAVALGQRSDEWIRARLIAAGVDAGDLDLDRGTVTLSAAWLDDEDVLTECQRVAAAEGGWFYFDALGNAVFRRATALLERADSLTSQADLVEGRCWVFGQQYTWRDVYGAVVVEWSNKQRGLIDVVYEATRPLIIPPGGTVTHVATFQRPAMDVITPVWNTDYRPVTMGGVIVDEGVTGVEISCTAYGQRAEVSVVNHLTAQAIYLQWLRIRGYPVESSEDEVRFETTLSPAKVSADKVLAVRVSSKTGSLAEDVLQGNQYIQSRAQANGVGGHLRDLCQYPQQLIRWEGPGCPWLELGDMVHVAVDAVEGDYYVIGNRQNGSPGVYRQELLLLPADHVFPYSSAFILGASRYHNSGSDRVVY